MKRLILTLTLLTIGFICNAQYNPYYNPYLYAAIAAETDDTYRLNNIGFDENAIKQNPEAWDNYLNYLSINANYSKTYRTYSIVGWSGVGIMLASLIPLLSSDSDSSLAWGCGLLGAGTIVSSVGLIGIAVQIDKIKTNKKDFIYYLKTSNNGVGIVTIF